MKSTPINQESTIETSPQNSLISFKLNAISSHVSQGIVTIDPLLINPIRNQTLQLFANSAEAQGLDKIPLSYIEHNYKQKIDTHLKNFLYHFFVLNHLSEAINAKKIPLAHHPRLANVELEPEKPTQFTFDLSLANPLALREWRNFVFKPPRRKNYKDLDKQVDSFIKKMLEKTKQYSSDGVEPGDWVGFDASIFHENKGENPEEYTQQFWIKISSGSLHHPLLENFIGKKVGESFTTTNLSLCDTFEPIICDQHPFFISIISIMKESRDVFDAIKHMFRLQNKATLHEKLIEIFSSRNDLSQRRAIIEEMFHLLFSKHRFEIPKHMILRKQEDLLDGLCKRPDYQAYRSQHNFARQLITLSEQLLKEEILIDQISYHEKIKVDVKDIRYYLNVLSNDRLKEFIYFRSFLDNEQDYMPPIHKSILQKICRREKTLNYILYHLTR